MLEQGQRVYVRAPFRQGAGVVESVAGGKVRVRMDAGSRAKVAPEHVHPLSDAPRAGGNTLTREPAYDGGELAVVAKEPALRSRAYCAWIRTLRCEWCSKPAPSEVSHHPEDGHGSVAMKTSDIDTLPLCRRCHGEWHQRGTLGRMTGEQARQWAQIRIKRTVQRYLVEVMGLRVSA